MEEGRVTVLLQFNNTYVYTTACSEICGAISHIQCLHMLAVAWQLLEAEVVGDQEVPRVGGPAIANNLKYVVANGDALGYALYTGGRQPSKSCIRERHGNAS